MTAPPVEEDGYESADGGSGSPRPASSVVDPQQVGGGGGCGTSTCARSYPRCPSTLKQEAELLAVSLSSCRCPSTWPARRGSQAAPLTAAAAATLQPPTQHSLAAPTPTAAPEPPTRQHQGQRAPAAAAGARARSGCLVQRGRRRWAGQEGWARRGLRPQGRAGPWQRRAAAAAAGQGLESGR